LLDPASMKFSAPVICLRTFLLPAILLACSGAGTNSGTSDASTPDLDATAPTLDATVAVDAGPVNKAERCTSSYGNILTAPFGRLDGTVHAVLKPTDQQCNRPNRTHIVLQVKAQSGIYRMVVNVQSLGADPDVRFAQLEKPLPAPAFAEGWHTGVLFDYAKTLDVHTAQFTPVPFDMLIERVVSAINLEEEVSVYSSTDGGDSSHLVHRNRPDADGAIFLSPRSAKPRVLLFHFSEQMF
jgi:hypothetical protein